ncbi:hypothetical protein COCNU_08G008660 [Cocos nucifera]|uniref:Uncharacterized protein n=1 Tax=Cocos nucifera TaxID=13894 RepID=A0A8K0IIN2_COCNU|nr:hypothetical protein COCNU_08G008660 [Cocos nucifera]
MLLTYQRDLDHWKSTTDQMVEEFKAFEEFIEEVLEASEEAFESSFNGCKKLVGKLFSDLNLGGVTQEAILALVSRTEAQLAPKVGSTELQPAPEVPIISIKLKVEVSDSAEAPAPAPMFAPTKIPISALVPTGVISLKDDSIDAAPPNAPQVDA